MQNAMGLIKYLFILFFTFSVHAQVNLNQIRVDYAFAASNEELCEQNLAWLQTNASSPTHKGYLGAYQMMMAKHAFNPISKLSHFKKGKKELEAAIKSQPKNLELRFIRLTIQENVPSLLNYSSQIQEDKTFILTHITDLKDTYLVQAIGSYLKSKT